MTALYVHLPWCVRKCPYCDFNSHALRTALPEAAYVDALLKDYRREQARLPAAPARHRGGASPGLRSVYFGGGTPSLFSPAAFERLLRAFDLAGDAEVTLEMNPGTVEAAGAVRAYASAGINRISLGAQSFDDAMLRRLGRIHGAADNERAAEAIRGAGFPAFNIDLMFGLPQQSMAQALDDLECAIALGATHVSWYQLTIEPKTAFARRPPKLPDHDARADMAEAGQALLARHGFRRYEVSAFGRDGEQARHNVNYWTFGDYRGIGAGAHGKVTERGRIVRTAKASQPARYLADQSSTDAVIAPSSLPAEFMMNALRLVEGVEEEAFAARSRLPFAAVRDEVGQLRQEGLMREGRLALTPLGYRHLDTVVARFL